MFRQKKFSINDIKQTVRGQDAWWQALVVDPLAIRITWFFINYTKITANQVTFFSFCLNVCSAWMFSTNNLPLGAVLFFCAFLLDCVDGKIARAKQLSGKLGQFLDVSADLYGHMFVMLGLIYGQMKIHGTDDFFIILVVVYVSSKFILTYQYLFEKELLGGSSRLQENKSPKLNSFSLFMRKYRLSVVPGSIDLDAIAYVIFPLLGAPIYGLLIAAVGFITLSVVRMVFVYRALVRL